MKVGPIREWPGERTRTRRVSQFRGTREVNGKRRTNVSVPLTQTLADLRRELRELGAKDAELLVAIPVGKFRQDGRPYANAIAEHPGIILSFDIPKVGHVSYPCDTFTTWEDNLRAVTHALEALRKVDRYGVTKRGEQYRGFLAIEATAMPSGFTDAIAAATFITQMSGDHFQRGDRPGAARAIRLAKRRTHPDTPGGDADNFQRVVLAEQYLTQNGHTS